MLKMSKKVSKKIKNYLKSKKVTLGYISSIKKLFSSAEIKFGMIKSKWISLQKKFRENEEQQKYVIFKAAACYNLNI
jgi:ribosomal protein L30E